MVISMSASREAGGRRFRRLSTRIGFLPPLLVFVVVIMSAIEPNFHGIMNVLNILRTTSILSIVSCGGALVLIIGGFDLSVGATIALASVVTAKIMGLAIVAFPEQTGWAIALGVLAGLGSGATVGLVNGFCASLLKISGFIVTLGTMSATAGIALLVTNGIPVYGMPKSFIMEFGRGQLFGLPTSVIISLAIVSAMIIMQRVTLLGRYFYAIGGNAHAATVSGVSTRRYVVVCYAISGVMAATAGILLTAQVGSGQASFGGDRMMLQAIAAAVIGGVRLRGGAGRIEMVALSALFLTILTNSLNLLRVDSRLQLVLLGLMMVAAVAADELSRRRKAFG